MAHCCSIQDKSKKHPVCPVCENRGMEMKNITLKSLLTPVALSGLEADTTYYFCPGPECNVVYFNDKQHIFRKEELKVPVFQKDTKVDIPICYCFHWTRERIREEHKQTGASTAVQTITAHIKAGRCGCEVNNPQGSCCLGNVSAFIKQAIM